MAVRPGADLVAHAVRVVPVKGVPRSGRVSGGCGFDGVGGEDQAEVAECLWVVAEQVAVGAADLSAMARWNDGQTSIMGRKVAVGSWTWDGKGEKAFASGRSGGAARQ